MRQFQIGATKAEVVAAIGQPSEKSALGEGERWYYEIMSSDEKSWYPYTGVFQDDKLTAWYFDTARVGKRGTDGRGGGPRPP